MTDARRRAGAALLSLALGIIASWRLLESGAENAANPDVCFLLSAALGAACLLVPRAGSGSNTRDVGLALWCAGVFFLGTGWGTLRLAGPLPLPVPMRGMSILRLTILENPRSTSEQRWSCLARARGLVNDDESIPLDERVWLSFESGSPPRPGDRLIARGTLHPVQPPRNPGEFDLRRWARDRSIAGTFTIPAPALLRPDESPSGALESTLNAFRRAIGAARQRAGETVDELASRASPDARELLRGLLLGENPRSSSEGLAAFYRLWLGYAALLIGMVLPIFAGLVSFPIGIVADFAISTARWWDSLPIATIRVPHLSALWALTSTTLLVLWFVQARLRIRGFVIGACALLVWAFAEMALGGRLPPGVAARLYLLDVAPGKCSIVRTPTGAFMINAGSSSPASGGRELAQIARELGAWRLETLVLDLGDERALSGAPEVVRTLRPRSIILIPGEADHSAHGAAIAELAGRFGIPLRPAPTLPDALSTLPVPLQGDRLMRGPGPGLQTRDIPAGAE